MAYKLIAFDLDGTFLDRGKNIPPRNMDALAAAYGRGAYIVPATGRIYVGIPEPLKAAPFARYFVTINGALVYDAMEDRAVYRAEISPEEALRFYEYMDSLGVLYDCYQDGFGFMTESMLDSVDEYMTDKGVLRLIKTLREPVPELKRMIREKGKPLQKLQAYFKDIPERDRQLKILPELFPGLLFSSSVSNNIEVNSAEAGKANGISALCSLLGLRPEDVIAFGDSTNDTDMLRFVGLGVAMGNALDEVKRAADVITSDNNSAGVADAIEKYVLSEEKP